MDASRFDTFTRTLAAGMPRRRLLRRAGAGAIAAAVGLRQTPSPAVARTSAEIALAGSCGCVWDMCDQPRCKCRETVCPYEDCPDLPPDCDIDCVLCRPDFGVAGGGIVAHAAGEAVLTLAVSAVLDDVGEPTGKGLGLLRWVDPTREGGGLVLESTGIGRYGPVGDLPGVRELDGRVYANGEGPFPFVMRVVDVGPDGAGQDTLSLAVGDAVESGDPPTGFSYAVEGTVTAGDLVGTWTLPAPPVATPSA